MADMRPAKDIEKVEDSSRTKIYIILIIVCEMRVGQILLNHN